jgi:hypothetical protein
MTFSTLGRGLKHLRFALSTRREKRRENREAFRGKVDARERIEGR